MRHLPAAIAAVALAVSAHTRWTTRRAIQRHTRHVHDPSPFTERLRARQRAEGEDRISVNGKVHR
jgi:hypothetical protein